MTFRMGGWRFAGKADRCLTPPSTSCSVSVMPPLSRTSISERFWPGSRNSKTASPASIEFRMDHDDQARSPAFFGGEESERHVHIDLPNAAFFASAKLSHRGYSTRPKTTSSIHRRLRAIEIAQTDL